MISCLQDHFGLIDVKEGTSGRYVNDLAGITTKRVDYSYSQDDTYDPTQAWDAIQRVAINSFQAKLMSWAKRFYINYSYLGTTITGQYTQKVIVTPSSEYKGVLFDYNNTTLKSLSLEIPGVNLWSEAPATTTIKAYNAATGEVLQAKAVTLSAGDNYIKLGWSFPVWRYAQVFIAYDASEVTTLQQDTYGFSVADSVLFKKVDLSSQVLIGNMSSSRNDNGLIVQFSLACSLDNFVCQRLALFEEPFLYALAVQILRESLRSENINRYTLLDFEQAQELITEYETKSAEMLESSLQGLTLDDSGICFACNRAVNFRTMLP